MSLTFENGLCMPHCILFISRTSNIVALTNINTMYIFWERGIFLIYFTSKYVRSYPVKWGNFGLRVKRYRKNRKKRKIKKYTQSSWVFESVTLHPYKLIKCKNWKKILSVRQDMTSSNTLGSYYPGVTCHLCNFLKLYGIEEPVIGLSVNESRSPSWWRSVLIHQSRKNVVSDVTRKSEVTPIDGIDWNDVFWLARITHQLLISAD